MGKLKNSNPFYITFWTFFCEFILQIIRFRRVCLHWRQKRKPCSIVCLYIIIKSPVRWRQSLGAKLEIICLHNRVFLLTLKEMEHKFFFAAVARGSKQFFTIITRHNSIQSFSLFKTLFIFLVCLLSFFLIQCTNVRWLKAQKRTKLFCYNKFQWSYIFCFTIFLQNFIFLLVISTFSFDNKKYDNGLDINKSLDCKLISHFLSSL